MTKINNRQELAAMREQYRDHVLMRLVSDEPEKRREVLVAIGDCGLESGSRETLMAFFHGVNDAKLEDVSVLAVDCMGDCKNEPMVEIIVPGRANVRYQKVTPDVAKEIIASHLVGGKILESAKAEV